MQDHMILINRENFFSVEAVITAFTMGLVKVNNGTETVLKKTNRLMKSSC